MSPTFLNLHWSPFLVPTISFCQKIIDIANTIVVVQILYRRRPQKWKIKHIRSVLSQSYRLPRSTICAASSSKGICALPAPPDQQLPPLQRFRSVNIFPLIIALLWLYYVNDRCVEMIHTFTSVIWVSSL